MAVTVVYGTGNPGKLRQMRGGLGLYGIAVRGLDEFGVSLEIPEDGETPAENARKKAIAYAQAVHQPVLSMDSALYFKGAPPELQPGLFVRRFAGVERASDTAMLEHYTQLITRLGGSVEGYWESGFALALPGGDSFVYVAKSPRIFVSKPHPTVPEGNPLMALQVDPATGKRLPDMSTEELTQTTHAYMAPLAAFLTARLA